MVVIGGQIGQIRLVARSQCPWNDVLPSTLPPRSPWGRGCAAYAFTLFCFKTTFPETAVYEVANLKAENLANRESQSQTTHPTPLSVSLTKILQKSSFNLSPKHLIGIQIILQKLKPFRFGDLHIKLKKDRTLPCLRRKLRQKVST